MIDVRCLLPECESFTPRTAEVKLCVWHLLPLAMVCYGKARRNRDSACREVRRRGNDANAKYVCPVCSDWHVGHTMPGRPDGTVRAAEVVREMRAARLGWYVGQLANDWHPSFVTRDPLRRWRSELTT